VGGDPLIGAAWGDGVEGTTGELGTDAGVGGRRSAPYAGNGPAGVGGIGAGLGAGAAIIGAVGSDV
jgi:hypothetical protein